MTYDSILDVGEEKNYLSSHIYLPYFLLYVFLCKACTLLPLSQVFSAKHGVFVIFMLSHMLRNKVIVLHTLYWKKGDSSRGERRVHILRSAYVHKGVRGNGKFEQFSAL